jgi:hypothetical protein
MFTKPFFPIVAMVFVALVTFSSSYADPSPEQYLAFQIFTTSPSSATLTRTFPLLTGTIARQVDSIIRATGTVGSKNRKLGFIVGPLAFGETDERVRELMREAFAIARDKNVAVGFHVDDSMFWDHLADLNRPIASACSTSRRRPRARSF